MKIVLITIIGIAAVLALGFLVMRTGQKENVRERTDAVRRDGAFSIFQRQLDGRPVFAMIDMDLRDSPDRQTLPFFLSLSSPLIDPTSDGLPTRSDADSLNAWEDAVEAQLRSVGKVAFVGRVTWDGHRELLYYVESQQPAVEALKKLSDSHVTRSFEFVCERDEKWKKAEFWLNRP